MRVRFSLVTPKYGAVAQLVEHWTENPSVVGSIPICPTIYGVLGKLVKPSSLQDDNCEFESRTRLHDLIQNNMES